MRASLVLCTRYGNRFQAEIPKIQNSKIEKPSSCTILDPTAFRNTGLLERAVAYIKHNNSMLEIRRNVDNFTAEALEADVLAMYLELLTAYQKKATRGLNQILTPPALNYFERQVKRLPKNEPLNLGWNLLANPTLCKIVQGPSPLPSGCFPLGKGGSRSPASWPTNKVRQCTMCWRSMRVIRSSSSLSLIYECLLLDILKNQRGRLRGQRRQFYYSQLVRNQSYDLSTLIMFQFISSFLREQQKLGSSFLSGFFSSCFFFFFYSVFSPALVLSLSYCYFLDMNLYPMCLMHLTLQFRAPSRHPASESGHSITGTSFFMIRSKPPTVISLPSRMPYRSTIESTSSIRPHLRRQSKSVLADMEGPPLTSISHGCKLLSAMKSQPQSSKELFDGRTRFCTDWMDLMMIYLMSLKHLLTGAWPNRENRQCLNSWSSHFPPRTGSQLGQCFWISTLVRWPPRLSMSAGLQGSWVNLAKPLLYSQRVRLRQSVHRTQIRMSNFLLPKSRGLSMYFWMMKVQLG